MRAVMLSSSPRLSTQIAIALGSVPVGLDAASSEDEAREMVLMGGVHRLLIADLDERDDRVEFVSEMLLSRPVLRALVCSTRTDMPRIRSAIERGAHEFVLKPIDADELRLRVGCLVARAPKVDEGAAGVELVLGPIRVHPGTHDVWLDGKPVRLTPRERSVLHLLMRGRSSVVSKERMAELIYALDSDASSTAIETYVYRLRRKLYHNDVEIRTLRGIGYQLTLRSSDGETRG